MIRLILLVIILSSNGMFFYSLPGIVSFAVKGDECTRFDGQESRECTPTEVYAMSKLYEW